MISLEVINDPVVATVALDPVRSQLLSELNEPQSASSLARTVGITRQKINYHLKTLETHGLVRQAETRKWGGITERVMVATASTYVISPAALGPVAADPEMEKDRLSANYLIALAARAVREVGDLVKLARRENKNLATLSMDAEISFASPADRAAFSRELTESVMKLVSKYHNASEPNSRPHRLMLVAHPFLKPGSETNKSNNNSEEI
jgi:DNA-binding transcriptional ArsR family regulator